MARCISSRRAGEVTGVIVLAIALSMGRSDAAAQHAAAPSDDPDRQTFTTVVAPFIKAHCAACHGSQRQKGELRLDGIDADLARGKDAARWKEVSDRLNRGEMPPKGEPRPSAADVEKVVAWIIGETRKADRTARSTGGRVPLRRMNRTEYANTVRDLLNVRFPLGDGPLNLLPPDGTTDGFDKVGSALTVDPSLLGAYLATARRVADAAIVSGPRPFLIQRRRFEYKDTVTSTAINYECRAPHILCRPHDLVLLDGAARTWDQLDLDRQREATIPVSGEYTIRLRMSADLAARGEPLKVQLRWPSDTVVAEWTLGRDDAKPRVFEVTLPFKIEGKGRNGPEVWLANGTTFYGFNQVSQSLRREAEKASSEGDPGKAAKLLAIAKAEGGASWHQPNPVIYDRDKLPKVILDWIEIEGPHIGEWPPASHRALFFEGKAATRDLAYVRRIFANLMPRAYRRPVTPAEVELAVTRVARELAAGESFEEAVRVGLQYVLCSPKFLYLVEPERSPERRPLDEHELASRLSYFLWSSMPDGELFRLAAEQRLHGAKVLADQVRRMLRDDKAKAFVDGFGAQWLQAARFVNVRPSRQLYKSWDDELEAAVKREPLAFFAEILRDDLSVLNFLDSGFAMLNGRLAQHYGIGGVEGPNFRKVKLPPDAHRGGLVTQAAILTIGSDGTRTLPVRRAAWILQTLFNSPPAPPPPNVREVEPNVGGKRLTVRERLLEHQKIPACASCHEKIDAYGLALESYDAVGRWRTQQNGEDFGGPSAPPIDPSGRLPDGRAFHTTDEFRALLSADRARFCRALAGRMLTYALGRSIEPAVDADTVTGLVAALEAGGYRMSALVTAIVNSPAFASR